MNSNPKKKTRQRNKQFIESPYLHSSPDQRKKKKTISFSISEENDNNSDLDTYTPYQKNYNPIIKKNNVEAEPDSLKILTNLAFTDPDQTNEDLTRSDKRKATSSLQGSDHILSEQDASKKINLVDDNNVLIGNELLHKGTQFDVIASKVLNMCNVYHSKSKHNNTRLKKRAGKMMMTRGMTVSQFEKKYNLVE